MKKEQRKFIAYTLVCLFFFTGCTNSLFSESPPKERPVPEPYAGEITTRASYEGYDDPALQDRFVSGSALPRAFSASTDAFSGDVFSGDVTGNAISFVCLDFDKVNNEFIYLYQYSVENNTRTITVFESYNYVTKVKTPFFNNSIPKDKPDTQQTAFASKAPDMEGYFLYLDKKAYFFSASGNQTFSVDLTARYDSVVDSLKDYPNCNIIDAVPLNGGSRVAVYLSLTNADDADVETDPNKIDPNEESIDFDFHSVSAAVYCEITKLTGSATLYRAFDTALESDDDDFDDFEFTSENTIGAASYSTTVPGVTASDDVSVSFESNAAYAKYSEGEALPFSESTDKNSFLYATVTAIKPSVGYYTKTTTATSASGETIYVTSTAYSCNGHNITLSADSYILTYMSESESNYAGQRKPLPNGGSMLLKYNKDNSDNGVISFFDSGYQLQETINFNYAINDFGNLSVSEGVSVTGGAVGGVVAFSETAAAFIFYDSDGKTTTPRTVNLADIYIEKDLVDGEKPTGPGFTPTPMTQSSIIDTTAEGITNEAVEVDNAKAEELASTPAAIGEAKNPDIYGVENILILGLDDYLFTTLNSGVVRYKNGTGAAIAGEQLSMNEPLFRSWRISDDSYIAVGFLNPKKRYTLVPDMAQARVVTYSSIQ